MNIVHQFSDRPNDTKRRTAIIDAICELDLFMSEHGPRVRAESKDGNIHVFLFHPDETNCNQMLSFNDMQEQEHHTLWRFLTALCQLMNGARVAPYALVIPTTEPVEHDRVRFALYSAYGREREWRPRRKNMQTLEELMAFLEGSVPSSKRSIRSSGTFSISHSVPNTQRIDSDWPSSPEEAILDAHWDTAS